MRVPLSYENAKAITKLVFEPESTICEYCGKPFPPSKNGQRFCSNKCRRSNYWCQVRSKNARSAEYREC